MKWSLFSPKQLLAIETSDARVNVFDGPVRSGKTVSQLVRWTDYLHEAPEGPLLMTGKTKDTLRQNILDPLFEIWGSRNYRYKESTGELWAFGRKIICRGANDEKSESRIRGGTFAGWLADEVTLYPKSFVEMALTRLSLPGAKAFWTCNPDSPFHFIYTDWIDNQELIRSGQVKRFAFVLDDNLSLSEEYKASLKSFFKGLFYKRMILGLWCMAEGVIYDMFDAERHKVDELPKNLTHWIVAVDYGTSNPCVFGLIGWAGGKHYLAREYYWDSRTQGRQKTDSEYAEDMKRFLGGIRPEAIYVDPSAASFIVELRKRGIGPVLPAVNDVLPGIQTVSRLLGNDEFFVHSSCVNTLREFGAYAWDPRAQKRGKDEPLKENDHAMDMVRYGLHSAIGAYEPMETGYTDIWG